MRMGVGSPFRTAHTVMVNSAAAMRTQGKTATSKSADRLSARIAARRACRARGTHTDSTHQARGLPRHTIGKSRPMPRPPDASLGVLIEQVSAAEAAVSVLGGADSAHSRALHALAEQAIHRGIDYRTLGLGWDHPTSRVAYRKAQGVSFNKPASRDRQVASRIAIASLVASIAALPSGAPMAAERLIISEFCSQIGAPAFATNATFDGVLAALDNELLLPLRAFNEGITSMYTTFNGAPVPPGPVKQAVHDLVSATLANRFSEWRYTNPIGARQLEGLSADQIAKWREPTSSTHGELRVHEDEEGELGFWWATKIGGPSHGFDLEGQCLLPLLCNARHKVILVSDPAYPHHPSGRAHFRLLWVHGTSPPRAVLWLETVNSDFEARVNTRAWLPAVLLHAASKAAAMGIGLSVESFLGRQLAEVVTKHLGSGESDVAAVKDRLVLRPSNGVVEASDYLSHKHDWVQMEEEVTQALDRALYTPPIAAAGARVEL